MRVLFLGPTSSPIACFLAARGELAGQTMERLNADAVRAVAPDWIVSHGYRFLLKRSALDVVEGRAVNCHIAFLPWNRGADPNLWSWHDGTPKGITIHFMDDGLDSGDMITQLEIGFSDASDEYPLTLRSTYDTLQRVLSAEFERTWSSIVAGQCARTPQYRGGGSFHHARDIARIERLLTHGWDTPVRAVRRALAIGMPSRLFVPYEGTAWPGDR